MTEARVGNAKTVPFAISHYKVLQKLRSGGMGDVYLAEDEVLPRVVALKLLPHDRAADELLQRRFLREARAASLLTHPNVARIYEAGEDGGVPFIAMEFIDGESLDARAARAPLTIDEVISIAVQIASAVEDAHRRGIIHRDLKPSNIMLTPEGHVKVLDFGLAKFTDEGDGADLTEWKTKSGLVLGTAPYMSPEQALGKEADARSDVFSLGAVLYEMVTGRPPFGGTSAADTLYRVVNTQPESMARFNYDLPLELERIIRKCLEKETSRRYQSFSDLLVDLRNLVRDREQGRGLTEPRRVLPKRAVLGAILLIAAVVTGVLLWRRSAPVARPIRSVAVLPFENRAGASADDLADGLTDMLIADLAQLPNLRVMARSTSFRYRNAESPAAAGRALRVDAVVTGNISTDGDRIVVSSELVNVRDGSRIGGSRVERARAEVATLAATVGDEIARALKIERTTAPARAAVSDEAYRLYLRGRQEWNKRTPEGFAAALELFRQAIEIEPRFAPAYAGLADTYALLERYASVQNAQSRSRAISAAERAVQLDDSLPEAHASLASVRETYAWDWKGAEEEYRTAIRLSPSYATAHQWHALLLTRLGRFDEARAQIRTARELDPLSPVIVAAAAHIEYYRGDYRRSIDEARSALQLSPDFDPARVQLALSLMMSGDTNAALRELSPIRASMPSAAAVEAVALARAGHHDKVRGLLRGAESRPDATANSYALAAIHLSLGDRERALSWLETAADARSSWLGYLAVDPVFAPLRGEPRFKALLDRIGLPTHA